MYEQRACTLAERCVYVYVKKNRQLARKSSQKWKEDVPLSSGGPLKGDKVGVGLPYLQ